MPTSYAEIMEVLHRLDITVNGDSSRDKKGLVERVNNHEDFVNTWERRFEKIFIAIMLGSVGALGSLGLLIKILIEVKSH
jgi:hypothetical protein